MCKELYTIPGQIKLDDNKPERLFESSRTHVCNVIKEEINSLTDGRYVRAMKFMLGWLEVVYPRVVAELAAMPESKYSEWLHQVAAGDFTVVISEEILNDPAVHAQLMEHYMPIGTTVVLPYEVQALYTDIQQLTQAIHEYGYTAINNKRYNEIAMRWQFFKLQAHGTYGGGSHPNPARDHYHTVMHEYRNLVKAVNACV